MCVWKSASLPSPTTFSILSRGPTSRKGLEFLCCLLVNAGPQEHKEVGTGGGFQQEINTLEKNWRVLYFLKYTLSAYFSLLLLYESGSLESRASILCDSPLFCPCALCALE